MSKRTDISSKRLISLHPNEWVRWVTGQADLAASQPLDPEFAFISRQTDALVMTTSEHYGRFLVLIEVQLRYRAEMPYRICAYAALAREKYRLPVYPVLINILPSSPSTVIPTCYESEFMGLTARQDYRVINLWEMDADRVLRAPLPVVAPFVPVMRGGDTVDALRQAVDLLRADERMADFESLLGVLAGIKLKKSIIEQIVRLDMSLVRETTWFEEAVEEGRQEGWQGGLRQQLLHVLRHRFGPVSEEVVAKLQSVDAQGLEDLVDVALDASSFDEFARHLPESNGDPIG